MKQIPTTIACLLLLVSSISAESVPTPSIPSDIPAGVAQPPKVSGVALDENGTSPVLPESNISEATAKCMPFLVGVGTEQRNSYIETSLVKLGIKCGLFGAVLTEEEELGKKPLTNEELDDIFLSFMVEKERKKEEERLKLEYENTLKAMMAGAGGSANGASIPSGPSSGTPIYPRNMNNPLIVPSDKEGFRPEAQPLPQQENLNAQATAPVEEAEKKEIIIVGIMCDQGKCTAYTSEGSLTIGKKIGDTEEKVLAVKSSGIKTDKRWISFD